MGLSEPRRLAATAAFVCAAVILLKDNSLQFCFAVDSFYDDSCAVWREMFGKKMKKYFWLRSFTCDLAHVMLVCSCGSPQMSIGQHFAMAWLMISSFNLHTAISVGLVPAAKFPLALNRLKYNAMSTAATRAAMGDIWPRNFARSVICISACRCLGASVRSDASASRRLRRCAYRASKRAPVVRKR